MKLRQIIDRLEKIQEDIGYDMEGIIEDVKDELEACIEELGDIDLMIGEAYIEMEDTGDSIIKGLAILDKI